MKERIKNKIEELLSKEYYSCPAELNSTGTLCSINPINSPI